MYEHQQTKLEFLKFKRNFTLFSSLLNNSDTIDTTLSDSQEIVLGNDSSPLELTIVTSPFCGHCRPVHQLIENILQQFPNEVKIKVRFNVRYTEKEDDLIQITSRLLELYHESGPEKCLDAMHDIYGPLRAKQWLEKWNSSHDKSKYIKFVDAHRDWCLSNQINFTPAILINGRTYPTLYDRQDLIFFIEELHETATLK